MPRSRPRFLPPGSGACYRSSRTRTILRPPVSLSRPGPRRGHARGDRLILPAVASRSEPKHASPATHLVARQDGREREFEKPFVKEGEGESQTAQGSP